MINQNTKPLKKLLTLFILAIMAVGCSKNSNVPEAVIPTEAPDIAVPAQSITVVKDGIKRTATIKGSFSSLHFTQIYPKQDGTLPGPKDPARGTYNLEYDKLKLSTGQQQQFTFTRTAPYTYIFVYSVSSTQREYDRINLFGANSNYEFEF
jgi:hypothetical protein